MSLCTCIFINARYWLANVFFVLTIINFRIEYYLVNIYSIQIKSKHGLKAQNFIVSPPFINLFILHYLDIHTVSLRLLHQNCHCHNAQCNHQPHQEAPLQHQPAQLHLQAAMEQQPVVAEPVAIDDMDGMDVEDMEDDVFLQEQEMPGPVWPVPEERRARNHNPQFQQQVKQSI